MSTLLQSKITLTRRAEGTVDRWRAYRVSIDDTRVDKINRGETKSFPVTPGDHVVRLRLDWMSGQPIEVNAPEGDDVELYCEPRGKPVIYLFWALFRPTHYITLRKA